MNGRHTPRLLRPGVPALAVPRVLHRPASCQLAFVFGGILSFSELFVFVSLSPLAGAALAVSSVGLAAAVRQQLLGRSRATEARAAAARENAEPTVDSETRLPNRGQLIDQLVRDIARTRRYSHDLTLAVVEIARFDDFRASWGPETTRAAVLHVAETLRRVTRSSDFVARLDSARFAILLIQCDETQAGLFGDRLSLAVSNRPLRSATAVRIPLYVGVDVVATQYSGERFRGPLDFLSVAGGDVLPETEPGAARVPARPRTLAADPQALRRQLVRDYYPEGRADDFADAYREHRNRARRVI